MSNISESRNQSDHRMKDDDLWTPSTEFPDELHHAENGMSVDVLAYSDKTEEHTIAWFDFKIMKWTFLCREAFGKFKWRYLNQEIDKPKNDGM